MVVAGWDSFQIDGFEDNGFFGEELLMGDEFGFVVRVY